ncbi:tetratricopeptide repeat protein [Gabonia massiliensis]|uniref:tetratricopeptide repeat protein n=1 Tax=Gabonia massiliensis TaxID=1686296 RepID=UPI0006D82A20|nr:tetratricopeptide repeat protein [Gabonia massiliensis]
MKKTFLTATLCLAATGAFAQMKSVNQAFSEAKMENPNFKEARATIQQTLTNPETENVAKTWYVAGFIENKAFGADQKKQLLNQKVDEKNLYNALYDNYKYYIKAVGLDTLPNEKNKVKPKYLKDIRNTLKNNHVYFWNAGGYFFNANDFKTAYKMWNVYLDIPKLGFMAPAEIKMDSTYTMIKYNAAIAAIRAEDNKLAIKCLEELKKDNYNPQDVYKLLTYEYELEKDTVNLINTLKEAVNKFGSADKDSQFMLRLINLYIYTGKSQEAIDYLKKAVEAEPQNAEYWKVMGGLYYESLKDEEKAIECILKAIEIKPDYAEALGELGRIYYNRAVNFNTEISNIRDNKKYQEEKEKKVIPAFKEALPYYEKAHQLKPDENEYKIALRGIYYNLDDAENLKKIEAEMGALVQ